MVLNRKAIQIYFILYLQKYLISPHVVEQNARVSYILHAPRKVRSVPLSYFGFGYVNGQVASKMNISDVSYSHSKRKPKIYFR